MLYPEKRFQNKDFYIGVTNKLSSDPSLRTSQVLVYRVDYTNYVGVVNETCD